MDEATPAPHFVQAPAVELDLVKLRKRHAVSLQGGKMLQDDFNSLPYVRAILIMPFWLPEAPRPLPVERRHEILKKVAVKMNKENSDAPTMNWEVLELDWSRRPHLVERPKIWHPKAAISRKGSILSSYPGSTGSLNVLG
jgi:hypothetical protein